MLIKSFYFLVRQVCKILGLSFSFSSDGEDLILMKYLCRIRNGSYIDIGSHQPALHSNTFLFYLSGWSGICIDPLPNLQNKYKFIRRRDKFINAGIIGSKSKTDSKLNFFYYKNNRDNITFDPERVKELSSKFGREPSSIIDIPTLNIAEMLSSSGDIIQDIKEINLLNLDIEGFEIDILEDLFSVRSYPWVVCVEELGKTAETLNNGDIHQLMTSNGYMLGARTFLSSIYILKSIIGRLPSPYVKELKL